MVIAAGLLHSPVWYTKSLDTQTMCSAGAWELPSKKRTKCKAGILIILFRYQF